MIFLKKKYVIISSIILFGLGFIYHGVYDMVPSIITSIFFPVNESVFEHNKMILTSYITTKYADKLKRRLLSAVKSNIE